jgi:hypothetical protein
VLPVAEEAQPSEGDPKSCQTGISFLNEPLSILNTLAAGGENNTDVHKKLLLRHLKKGLKEGVFYMEFDLKATAEEVPMNWFLSQNGLKRIEEKARQLAAEIPDLKINAVAPLGVMDTATVKTAPPSTPEIRHVSEEKTGNEHISPATHPHLYYYSKKKKMWKLKKDADFNISAIKPLSRKFQKRLVKSRQMKKGKGN